MPRRSGDTMLQQQPLYVTQNTKVPQIKGGMLIVKVPGTWLKIRQLMEIEQREESRDQGKWLVSVKKRFY